MASIWSPQWVHIFNFFRDFDTWKLNAEQAQQRRRRKNFENFIKYNQNDLCFTSHFQWKLIHRSIWLPYKLDFSPYCRHWEMLSTQILLPSSLWKNWFWKFGRISSTWNRTANKSYLAENLNNHLKRTYTDSEVSTTQTCSLLIRATESNPQIQRAP